MQNKEDQVVKETNGAIVRNFQHFMKQPRFATTDLDKNIVLN